MINIYKVLIYITLLIALTQSCSPAPGWVPSTNQERYDAADYVVTGEVVAWSGLFPGSDAEALWLGGDLEYYKAIFPPCTNGSLLVHGFKSTALCGVERFPVGTTITVFAKENPDHPSSLLLNYVSLHDGAIEGELVNVTTDEPLTTNETRVCPNYTEVVAVACTKDAKMCIDGTYVTRNASNNCEFNPCPTACMRCTKAPTTRPPPQTTTYSSEETSSSSVESSSSSESSASETGGTIERCTDDLKQCPDGSYIGRDEDNNCEFFECPEGGTLNCTSDAQMCPDGRTVGRDPNNNCSFYPCPDADTKCDWCLPETKDNETEPVTVTIPEECPYLVCDICYPSGLPLGNAENSSCGYGTSRFGGYCACWSGAYGANCTMDDAVAEAVIPYAWSDVSNLNYLNLDDSQADIHFEYNFTGHSTCSDFLLVDELITVAPPVIELATFVNSSYLHIVISQAMVSGRAETIAYLNPGHDIRHCIYPMSDYITKEIEGCKDVFDFNIPWNLSSTCNWRILDEETHISYCGQVILQHTEWMENICEWRFVQSVLNIKIRLQKHAKVTVETVVVNNPDVTAAITNQIVLVNCPEPVLIEITTRINWPYKLDTDFNLTLSPPEKIESFSLDYDDCTSEESRSCRQRWRTALELTGTACTLDGNYQLTFRRVLCASNDSSCPLDEEDANPVTVDYFLTSENFCAVVKVDISLSATIEVYEDANFTETRTLFLVGQTAYFRAKVTSLSNNEENPVIFSRISIKSVTIRGELVNVPVYIYENGEPQTISGATGEESVSFETITLDSTDEIGFSFELTSSLITKVLRKNGKSTFIVGVEIEVSYASGQLKRGVLEVLATGTDAATFSVEAGVTDFNSNQVDAASALVLSLMLLVVIALFF